MKNFKEFYYKLQSNPTTNTIIKIQGVEKKIKGMVRLTSKNYLSENNEYIKIIFTDGSFLLALKNEEELYYADEIVGHIKEITEEMIGSEQIISFKDKEYKLVNKDDYQFVLSLLVGSPLDIEGECKFSDYFPVNGAKEFLSLGWLVSTGERADINPKFIDNKDVEILN
jgi:hypothetical protein